MNFEGSCGPSTSSSPSPPHPAPHPAPGAPPPPLTTPPPPPGAPPAPEEDEVGQENKTIRVTVEDDQNGVGLMVVSFRNKDNQVYQGVLLQINRELGIPAGIMLPKPSIAPSGSSTQEEPNPLKQRHLYFQDLGNSNNRLALRRVIKPPARFKNSRVALRFRQRPLLCARCQSYCDERDKELKAQRDKDELERVSALKKKVLGPGGVTTRRGVLKNGGSFKRNDQSEGANDLPIGVPDLIDNTKTNGEVEEGVSSGVGGAVDDLEGGDEGGSEYKYTSIGGSGVLDNYWKRPTITPRSPNLTLSPICAQPTIPIKDIPPLQPPPPPPPKPALKRMDLSPPDIASCVKSKRRHSKDSPPPVLDLGIKMPILSVKPPPPPHGIKGGRVNSELLRSKTETCDEIQMPDISKEVNLPTTGHRPPKKRRKKEKKSKKKRKERHVEDVVVEAEEFQSAPESVKLPKRKIKRKSNDEPMNRSTLENGVSDRPQERLCLSIIRKNESYMATLAAPPPRRGRGSVKLSAAAALAAVASVHAPPPPPPPPTPPPNSSNNQIPVHQEQSHYISSLNNGTTHPRGSYNHMEVDEGSGRRSRGHDEVNWGLFIDEGEELRCPETDSTPPSDLIASGMVDEGGPSGAPKAQDEPIYHSSSSEGDSGGVNGLEGDEESDDLGPLDLDPSQLQLDDGSCSDFIDFFTDQENRTYKKGDIVWGKLPGMCWWPGKIVYIICCESEIRAIVSWYNTDFESAISFSFIAPYFEEFECKYKKTRTSLYYQNSVRDALIEAHQLKPEDLI